MSASAAAAGAPSSATAAAAVAAAPATSGTLEAPVIRALSTAVVNRIAAGEVIHRPSSALKELLENAIDARATRVTVTLTDGGLHTMAIQDNGCGIRSSDFPILCERFTTSKLSEYADLQSIATFGFRGEALASITHVARVAITSMTRGSTCAYRADFRDGHMVDPANPDPDARLTAPKACAGVPGTTLLIEDLFHNVPIRRNALKNAHNEEYAKCLDVLCKYALHYAGQVSVSCKKNGANKMDLNTQLQATHVDHVRSIYGANIAKELLPVALDMNGPDCRARGIDSSHFRATGLVSNANFSQKKLTLILFINQRLVESPNIRRAIDNIYSRFLPKGTHPFVYLALSMDARILDVNVHPTKKEVHFLYEELMVAALEEALESVLKGANKSRVFYTQSILAGQNSLPLNALGGTVGASALPMMSSLRGAVPQRREITEVDDTMEDVEPQPAAAISHSSVATASSSAASAAAAPVIICMDDEDDKSGLTPTSFPTAAASTPPRLPQAGIQSRLTPSAVPSFSALRMPSAPAPAPASNVVRRDNHLVRTDNRQGRIDSFLTQSSQAQPGSADKSRKRAHVDLDDDVISSQPPTASSSAPLHGAVARRPKPPVILLTSVQNLLSGVSSHSHSTLGDLFKHHTFVGFVDHAFSLVQHQTKLYLVNVERISAAFFYETALRHFGHLPLLRFTQAMRLRPLLRLALDHKDASATHPLPANLDAYATELTQLLLSRAAMLHEYFALEISTDLDGEAVLAGIPELLEQYNPPLVLLPLFLLRLARDCDWSAEQECFDSVARCIAEFYRFQKAQLYLPDKHAGGDATLPSLSSLVSHVFFPLLRDRSCFSPPAIAATDGTITQVASLENLYKIFERC